MTHAAEISASDYTVFRHPKGIFTHEKNIEPAPSVLRIMTVRLKRMQSSPNMLQLTKRQPDVG